MSTAGIPTITLLGPFALRVAGREVMDLPRKGQALLAFLAMQPDRRVSRELVADPELRAFFRQLMDEALAVGRAKGVTLDQSVIESRMDFVVNKVEPGMKASMAHDLERGNRLELDWLSGKVREFGRELGIPTPASDTVWTVLKLHRMGTQG